MRKYQLFCGSFLLATLLPAQSVTLRGTIEDVQGTANQFFLDGTNVSLFSTALNLNQLQGQQLVMQVVDVGVPGAPLVRVDSAVPATQILNMGNLRLGQTSTFDAVAPTNSLACFFLDLTANTSFFPLFDWGSWVLSPTPVPIGASFTTAPNLVQMPFTTPADPSLTGLHITCQALICEPGGLWYLSNPDDKTVRP